MQTVLSTEFLLEKAKTFDGWFNNEEMELMFNTISSLKNQASIVEIGSWCGRSLTVIAAAALKTGLTVPIYSIDPYVTTKDEPNGKYDTFVANMKSIGIWDRITQIREKSQIAGVQFTDKIEFLFIDGLHKYEAVKTDFELFSPKVIDGGYIALHDMFSFYGPTKLVEEILDNSSLFKFIERKSQTLILQKKSHLTEQDKAQNQEFLTKLKKFMLEHGHKLHR